ncbi:MAG: MBL fold metallo-hydrolase [Methanomassiliicoccales archaeon]
MQKEEVDRGLKVREADRLEVMILVDNYTDVLSLQSTDVVKRPMTPPPDFPLAEHGLSCLLKVCAGSEEHIVMMDAGVSPTCLFHNARVLRRDLSQVESAVLSHGHFDHYGGLVEFLTSARKGIPLFLHPDAFLDRRFNIPGVGPVSGPGLHEKDLEEIGVAVHKIKEPTTVASDLILISGEVRRVTSFEKGFPWAEAKINDKWVVDPFNDDQGIAVKVKNKGLVIISGCAHAGIVNTVKHFQRISRSKKVHAIIGGFHLTGSLFDPIIAPTIEEIKRIGPDFVVPMHCTGWKAIGQFAKEMPQQFLLNTVGTTYIFQQAQ